MGVSAAALMASITEAATAASTFVASTGAEVAGTIGSTLGPTGLGLPAGVADAIGSGTVGAVEQGAVGAALNPRNPLKGAEAGAITGGTMGAFAPAVSGALDIGMTGADALTGAVGGAAGAAATGGNIVRGGLQGGASGAAAGALGLGPQPTATTGAPTAPGTSGGPIGSAGGSAAPASVAAAGPDAANPFKTTVSGAPDNVVPSGASDVATGPPTSLLTPAGSLASSPPPGNVGVGAAAGGGTTSVGGPAATTLPTTALPSSFTPSSPEVGGKQVGSLGATTDAATKATGNAVATDTTGATGGAKEGGTGFLGKMLDNPGALLSAAGMGASLLQGNKLPKQAGILSSQAADLISRGKRLENYMETGTLPPGMQQNLDAATNAGIASIKQTYANRGMSGSSAEQQDIENLRITAAAQGADLATKLLQQGVNDTQLGDDLYKQLLDIQMQQDQALSTSIGNFASAFAGLSRPITTTAAGVTG